jgi:hypothetical protein
MMMMTIINDERYKGSSMKVGVIKIILQAKLKVLFVGNFYKTDEVVWCQQGSDCWIKVD